MKMLNPMLLYEMDLWCVFARMHPMSELARYELRSVLWDEPEKMR